MTYVYSILKYLVIGICLGIGILLADQLYFKYGNPRQIAVMEEMLEELYESQSDLIDLRGLSSCPGFSFHVFGKSVNFEERCTIYLQQLPAVRCQDQPHSTSVRLSRRDEKFDAQMENVQRTAVDGSFRDEEREGFRVIRWFTDIEKLSEVLNESRTDDPLEPRGTPIEFPELPPLFSSMVCAEDTCITISSASRTKVEGLVAQIVEQ
jgi:hypothetical protein